MFAFFTLDTLIKHWRAALVVVAVLAVLVFGAVERIKGYRAGQEQAHDKIERANQEALSRATKGAKNVEDCDAAGGDWDRDHGVCNPAAAR